ncbi:bacteriohemerythrin [Paramagnetospirillum kuznetsovii]|nr:hemerythrin family protein [Paramagnetospirillum kuznetsovii]
MLKMTDDLRIGHPIIDMDHQRLLDIINDFNRLSVSLTNKRMMHQTLKALHKYGEEHFLREQKIQIEFGYPYCNGHAAEHKKLTDQIAALATDFFINKSKQLDLNAIIYLNQFLEDWIVRHVKKHDMTMQHYLVKSVPSDHDGIMAVERFRCLDMVALVIDESAKSREFIAKTLIRMGIVIVLEADSIVDGMKKAVSEPVPDFLVVSSGLEYQKFMTALRTVKKDYIAEMPTILALDPIDAGSVGLAEASSMQGSFTKVQNPRDISMAIRSSVTYQ